MPEAVPVNLLLSSRPIAKRVGPSIDPEISRPRVAWTGAGDMYYQRIEWWQLTLDASIVKSCHESCDRFWIATGVQDLG